MSEMGKVEGMRVQLNRKKGWRMPPNTVKVSRPGKWGNPFAVGQPYETVGARTRYVTDAAHAVRLFLPVANTLIPAIQAELRGKNLACWCALCEAHKDGKPFGVNCADCSPCHSDVLGNLANSHHVCGGNHALVGTKK